MTTFTRSSLFPVSVKQLFEWHERPGAFSRLNPPWEPVNVISAEGGIQNGARVHLSIPFGPLKIPWFLGHKDYFKDMQFRDYQIRGPFKSWDHTHRFSSQADSTAELSDEIHYELPLAPFGELIGGGFTKKKLSRLFTYRHAVTKNDLEVINRYHDSFPSEQRILITGASGFVGTQLRAFLSCAGHNVTSLVRRTPKEGEIYWNPESDELTPDSIEGFDYIIHLAGENVAQRWTTEAKERILLSRVKSTELLANAIAKLQRKPKAFLCSSAIGFYGDQKEKVLDESSPLGQGFLADVCRKWEDAANKISSFGVRTVSFRVGIVLSPQGGALSKMLPPFKLGLGGPLGTGSHFMSWIALDDIIYALYHCMARDIHGAVNMTAPDPVTNSSFSTSLEKALHRPAILPTPVLPLKLFYGEFVHEALLASIRVVPIKLLNSGFTFTFGDLESCLSHFL